MLVDDGVPVLRSGDVEADFASFVRANYVALVRYGTSMCGDAGRAEDLAQVALLKLDRAWARVDPERRLGYTRTVIARLAWRQARRRWHGEVPTARVPEMAPGRRDDFGAVDDLDAVRRALDCLPLGQRIVLTLRYLDGLSEAETAEALGCSCGTVKSRTSRALEALRRSGLAASDEQVTAP